MIYSEAPPADGLWELAVSPSELRSEFVLICTNGEVHRRTNGLPRGQPPTMNHVVSCRTHWPNLLSDNGHLQVHSADNNAAVDSAKKPGAQPRLKSWGGPRFGSWVRKAPSRCEVPVYHPRKILANSDAKSCILVTTCCEISCFSENYGQEVGGGGPIHCWSPQPKSWGTSLPRSLGLFYLCKRRDDTSTREVIMSYVACGLLTKEMRKRNGVVRINKWTQNGAKVAGSDLAVKRPAAQHVVASIPTLDRFMFTVDGDLW